MPFAIKKGDAFNCILIFQDEFDYVETATVLHKFRNFFFFSLKDAMGVMVGIALNLSIPLGSGKFFNNINSSST